MSSTDPQDNLTFSEVEHLRRLEVIVQRGLQANVEVGQALAEIRDGQLHRDTHPSFAAYLHERWGASFDRDQLGQPPLVEDPATTDVGPPPVAEIVDEELVVILSWLLTRSGGTIARVAHELETREPVIDDDALAQLRDDVLVVEEELTVLKALLLGYIDWDYELQQLQDGEIPPLEDDPDADGNE